MSNNGIGARVEFLLCYIRQLTKYGIENVCFKYVFQTIFSFRLLHLLVFAYT